MTFRPPKEFLYLKAIHKVTNSEEQLMNLRRELRTKFEDVLCSYGMTVPEREPLAELLADAALSVSGIAKRQTDEVPAVYDVIAAANRKVDAILDMANAPGIKAEARRAAIQSYLGERLHVNTETKAWREFAGGRDATSYYRGLSARTWKDIDEIQMTVRLVDVDLAPCSRISIYFSPPLYRKGWQRQ